MVQEDSRPSSDRIAAKPPLMWPESGSGFEADPFRPAGIAQGEWGFIQRRGHSRYGRLVVWLALGLVAMMAVTPLVFIFARH